MAKRGRVSAASTEVARPNVEVQHRPDADYSLSDEAAEIWHAVVEALPADWIGPEALPLLSAYCRTTIALRRLGQLITAHEHGPDDYDVDYHTKLLRAHGQQAQTLKTLATSLRLTPQSRYRAETAARRIDDANPGRKPWELP